MTCGVLREEFRLHKLGLWFGKADAFYTSQWRWPKWVLLIYRIMVTCYISGWTIYLFVEIPKTGEHPTLAYFTQWAYLLLLSYQASTLAVLVYHTEWAAEKKEGSEADSSGNGTHTNHSDVENGRRTPPAASLPNDEVLQKEGSESPPDLGLMPPVSSARAGSDVMVNTRVGDALTWELKSTWLLHSMSSVCGLAVSAIYLCILLPLMLQYHDYYIPGSLDINLHIINSCIIILDCFITAIPIRLLHAIYPVSFAFLYIVFSAIYWALDTKRNVLYPAVLDWNHPGPTSGAVLAVNCILLPLMQLFIFGIYNLRELLYIKCFGHRHMS